MLPIWRSVLCTGQVSVSFRLSVCGWFIAYLLVSHATQAHFEHVQVIPAARQASINVWRDFVNNRENRAVCAWSDAVRICGMSACAEVIRPSERVVDVSRNAP
jgi:hypothetical protein